MSGVYISPATRQLVQQQAGNRCGYCLVPQALHYGPLEFEHLLPRSRGGLTIEENLWLACRACNGFKSDRLEFLDPDTNQIAKLFDPRRENWWSHFRWSDDGAEIIGITPAGRATVVALQLNGLERVRIRQRWVSVGWHPPAPTS